MLHLKFVDWLVDVCCYVDLVEWRTFVGVGKEVGETYRKRIGAPKVIGLIDRWGLELLKTVEEAKAEEVEVTWKGLKRKVEIGIFRQIPEQEMGNFADKLEREKNSSQFALEVRKIKSSPYFQILNLTYANVHGFALSEDAETLVEKHLLGHLGENAAHDTLSYEQKRQFLDKLTSKAQFVPEKLHRMGREVRESHLIDKKWPWQAPSTELTEKPLSFVFPDAPLVIRLLLAEAERRANRKLYEQKQEEKQEEQYRYETTEDAMTAGVVQRQRRASVIVQFGGEVREDGVQQACDEIEGAIVNQLDLRRRYEEIVREIQESGFYNNKKQHCLRLLKLCYRNGETPKQSEETARKIGVKLRALQGLIHEFRQRGWFLDSTV